VEDEEGDQEDHEERDPSHEKESVASAEEEHRLIATALLKSTLRNRLARSDDWKRPLAWASCEMRLLSTPYTGP
jgi:hypothetical protein